MSDEARPWDILNNEIPRVSLEEYRRRISTCLECDKYIKYLHVCSECGCMMKIKARLGNASCPLEKW
jgi:hypothetical protein